MGRKKNRNLPCTVVGASQTFRSLTQLGAQETRDGTASKVRLALSDSSFAYSWPSFDRTIAYFVPKSQNRNPIPRPATLPHLDLSVFFPLLASSATSIWYFLRHSSFASPRPSLSMHSIQLPLRPHPARCPPSAPSEVQATTLWMLLVEHASLVKEGSDWGVVRHQEEG